MPKRTVYSEENIFSKIIIIRKQKVMLDADLAVLYGVETKSLKRAVRRNSTRFPEDFMFELGAADLKILRYQIGTSNWGGTRYMPMAFTEQGIAMLSSVLNSDQAIEVNIQIMRIFVKMRGLIKEYEELLKKIEKIELEQSSSNQHIGNIYKIIKELIEPEIKKRNKIGYRISKGK